MADRVFQVWHLEAWPLAATEGGAGIPATDPAGWFPLRRMHGPWLLTDFGGDAKL